MSSENTSKRPNKLQRLLGGLVGSLGSFLSLPVTLPIAGVVALARRLKEKESSGPVSNFFQQMGLILLGSIAAVLFALGAVLFLPYAFGVKVLTWTGILSDSFPSSLQTHHRDLEDDWTFFSLELTIDHRRRPLAAQLAEHFLASVLSSLGKATFQLHKESPEEGKLTWGCLSLEQCRQRVGNSLENLDGWYQQNTIILLEADEDPNSEELLPGLGEAMEDPSGKQILAALRQRGARSCTSVVYWLEQGSLNVGIDLISKTASAALDGYLGWVEGTHGKEVDILRP